MITRRISLMLCLLAVMLVGDASGQRFRRSTGGYYSHCGDSNCAMCNSNWGYLQRTQPAVRKQPVVPDIQSTPQPVVEAMLVALKLTKDDLLYDPGCGDGRFCHTAVAKYGCRAVGIEIDPAVAAIAEKFKVSPRVLIQVADAKTRSWKQATAVAIYQDQAFLQEMAKKLQGVGRVVSYCHEIPGMHNRMGIIIIDGELHKFYLATRQYGSGVWLAI